MVKEPKCICPSRPDCAYPHTFLLGTPQQKSPPSTAAREAQRGIAYENRNIFEVQVDSLKPIIPQEYFKTTGDLISKLKILKEDATSLIVATDKLIQLAKKTQGTSQHLETSIVDEKVMCQPKTMKMERARREGEKNAESRGAAVRRSLNKNKVGSTKK